MSIKLRYFAYAQYDKSVLTHWIAPSYPMDPNKTMFTFIFMGSFYYSCILSQAIEAHIISIKELEFLTAAELMGISKIKIILNHIIRT